MILPARPNFEALIIDILARIAKTQPSWIEGMSPFQEEKMTKWLMMADHNDEDEPSWHQQMMAEANKQQASQGHLI